MTLAPKPEDKPLPPITWLCAACGHRNWQHRNDCATCGCARG